jgi:hypothetical protein
METFLCFIYWSTCETHTNNPFIVEINVNPVKLLCSIHINKKWNNLHPFQTNVKQVYPSETLELFHGQVLKNIPIAHALLNY